MTCLDQAAWCAAFVATLRCVTKQSDCVHVHRVSLPDGKTVALPKTVSACLTAQQTARCQASTEAGEYLLCASRTEQAGLTLHPLDVLPVEQREWMEATWHAILSHLPSGFQGGISWQVSLFPQKGGVEQRYTV